MRTPERVFTGPNQALFGFALSNIGDTNRDGYDDLAVGAPGIHSVYIFNGRPNGLLLESPQVYLLSNSRDLKSVLVLLFLCHLF